MRRSAFAVPAAAAVASAILGLYTLWLPFGRDHGILATVGMALKDGLLPYRDVFTIKPPMTFAVYWLAEVLFGHSVMSIRIIDLLLTMLGAAALAAASRRLLGSSFAALMVAVAFAAMYYAQSFWTLAQTDGWIAICVCGLVYVLTVAWSCPPAARPRYMVVAGVLLGVAFAFKYTSAAAGILLFAPLLAHDGRARFDVRDLGYATAGATAVIPALAGLMAVAGNLMPFLEIQAFVTGYVSGYRQPLSMQLLVAAAVPLRAQLAGVLVVAGAVVLAAHCMRRPPSLFMVVAALAVLAGWLPGMAQGKAASYHFLTLLVGCALLVGLAADRLQAALLQAAPLRRRVWRTVFVVALVATPATQQNFRLLAGVLDGEPWRQQWAAKAEGFSFSYADTVAFNEILSRHRQGEGAMFVWGLEMLLYYLQATPPAYRYGFSFPFAVNYYDGRYTRDLLARLEAAPPTYFIVQKRDATAAITGHDLDSRAVLERLPEIEHFLAAGYLRIEDTPRFELWRRGGHDLPPIAARP